MPLVNDIAYCTTCNVELTDDNWFKHFQLDKKKRYWCSKCYYEYYKPYTQKHVTTTKRNGKLKKIFGKKRELPDRCEICGRDKLRLQYHHLEEDEIKFKEYGVLPGMWLCRYCHIYGNFIENQMEEFLKKYSKRWIGIYKEINQEIEGGMK